VDTHTSYINGIRVVLLNPPSFLNGLLMHATIFLLTLTFYHPSLLNVKLIELDCLKLCY